MEFTNAAYFEKKNTMCALGLSLGFLRTAQISESKMTNTSKTLIAMKTVIASVYIVR